MCLEAAFTPSNCCITRLLAMSNCSTYECVVCVCGKYVCAVSGVCVCGVCKIARKVRVSHCLGRNMYHIEEPIMREDKIRTEQGRER